MNILKINLFFLIVALGVIIGLIGCVQESAESLPINTPEDALYFIEGEFSKILNIYETVSVNENRVLIVYRGIINGNEDVFVANVESEDSYWKATHAISIGEPSDDGLKSFSETEKFQAGYFKGTSVYKESDENIKIVNSEGSEMKVWIQYK